MEFPGLIGWVGVTVLGPSRLPCRLSGDGRGVLGRLADALLPFLEAAWVNAVGGEAGAGYGALGPGRSGRIGAPGRVLCTTDPQTLPQARILPGKCETIRTPDRRGAGGANGTGTGTAAARAYDRGTGPYTDRSRRWARRALHTLCSCSEVGLRKIGAGNVKKFRYWRGQKIRMTGGRLLTGEQMPHGE